MVVETLVDGQAEGLEEELVRRDRPIFTLEHQVSLGRRLTKAPAPKFRNDPVHKSGSHLSGIAALLV